MNITLDRVFDFLGAALTVAMITVLMTAPNTVGVLNSLGRIITGTIRTSMGR